MYDFVVREGEQVALVREIVHRPQQLAAVARPQVGLRLAEFERVVHPAEIPFVVEAEAALVHRTGDAGVGGRVLRDEQSGGVARLEAAVHAFEEVERIAVYAALLVSLPVDEARDRIHAQTVEMELLEPVIRGGLQKTPHLATGMDEIIAAPLAFSDRAVRILIKRRAVILREAVGVHREVNGDEIHDRADSGVMQPVDQQPELRRCAVARGGGEKAGVLIAPRAVKRVLGERQELDVRVAAVQQIGDEPVGELLIGKPAVCVLRIALP